VYRASKALSVGQARDYYRREYTRGDYYEHDTLERKGEWYGKGAERLGLRGEVDKAQFDSLLQGRGPAGDVLVTGEAATDKHRAGWDFTCSADKSVSLVALVGGDEGVRAAHRSAVDRSLAELERYVQTKDRSRERVTTGEMVAAKFEHESSRKLDPQLHTHVVVMNMTPRSDGQWRALEPREMFAAQRLVTATYRGEMARELARLGYPVEVRPDGSVGISGFTKAQLDHFSQRRAQIEKYLADRGVGGAAHAERAARTTRRAKGARS
jgi:conjugative relaxase-like TrwC/TraI family protein